jgi:hypothetical protein
MEETSDKGLSGSDMKYAVLISADLRQKDLSGADLSYADLRYAILIDACLRNAKLIGADLRYAILSGANLSGANLTNAKLPHFQIPQEGSLRVWGKKGGTLVEMQVPAWARRTGCLIGRKCRAEEVEVIKVYNTDGRVHSKIVDENAMYTLYQDGMIIYPDYYDDDIRVACTHGIHFFLTREEAEEWNL